MINPINSITNFTPMGYGINFRSRSQESSVFNFQPKLRPALVTDVFERSKTGGVNGSISSGAEAEKLFPFSEFKGFTSADSKQTVRNQKIEKEKGHIGAPVTKRTEYNTRQLRSAGVPENEVKKYLTVDGHVNFEGKRILREHGKSYQ